MEDSKIKKGEISPIINLKTSNALDERFRLLVGSITDYGIFMMDMDGFIQSWNAGAEKIKGYKSSDIIGKHFSIFYTDEDRSRNHPGYELDIAKKQGRYEEEGWRVRKDGTTFWANVTITLLRDESENNIGFAKVTRDLSERKQAELQLRDSEERARRIFESVKDYAMILLNPDGTISSWNEGARRIKGYEASEVIGKFFSIFYPEEDIQMGKCEYELKEAAETGRFEDEGWRIRKDGTRFWASVIITAVRGDNGKLFGYSKVTRDMTDRKRSDDLLKMAYANLEQRITERTRELTSTNEKLQEAIRARDEFLSIASHELRTPLTPLKLQIQSLISNIRRNTLGTMNPERLEKVADICDKSVTRLTSLIENLLDVSRINSGKLSLQYEMFDIVELCRDVIDRFKDEIQQSGSTVRLAESREILGSFDKLRIEQVILNLLTNSLKYGDGKPVDVEITANLLDVKIVFKDHGIGIAKQDVKRIFERFERVSSTQNIGGLGLGLYITQQIVSSHGGTVSVESQFGEGSAFTVILPLESRRV